MKRFPKKYSKLLFSIIASVVLAFTMCGTTAQLVYADDLDEGEGEEAHVHNDSTFTAWRDEDDLPTEPGHYYLDVNVTISDTMYWNARTGTIDLCLNGHSITGNAPFRFIDLDGWTLNLYDCGTTAGQITNKGCTSDSGGCVHINDGGTLNMYGGTICGNNTEEYGGGVFIAFGGTFNMHGGTICGNHADEDGGGVHNEGTFHMDGGTISGNSANYGGGVNTENSCKISGGTINDNTAMGCGGGVYVPIGNMILLSDSPRIIGNTAGNNVDNIYFASRAKAGITDTLRPADASEPQIGVSMSGSDVFTSGLNGKLPSGVEVSDVFFADSDDYDVKETDNHEAQLKAAGLRGSGTKDDPYLISNYEGLKQFAAKVNGENVDVAEEVACAELTKDIDCGNNKDWVPIGAEGSHHIYYRGHFNGNNHVIRNLSNENADPDNYQGLFGYIIEGMDADLGIVENVRIEGGKIQGNDFVGGVAGHNEGIIRNCCYDGEVSGKDNNNDEASYTGGVAGYNGGEITNCYNAGTVSGNLYVGGVAGQNQEEIINCYNTGTVSGNKSVGGVAGLNFDDGEITNCYNTGAVSGTNYVGGVAGMFDDRQSGAITNCYYDKTFSMVDAAIGEGSADDTVKGLTTSQMTGTSALNNMVFTFDNPSENPWLTKPGGVADDVCYWYYPHLKGFDFDGDEQMEADAISPADWPAKAMVDAKWNESDSFTYDGTAQGPTAKITVSMEPVKAPDGTTAEYYKREGTKWVSCTSEPTDPGSYKLCYEDGDNEVTIPYSILEENDGYSLAYQKEEGSTWVDVISAVSAGEYKAVLTLGGASVGEAKTFEIGKANLTIKANDQTFTYDGKLQGPGDLTYNQANEIAKVITVEGLAKNDMVDNVTIDGQGDAIGEYPLNITGVCIVNSIFGYAEDKAVTDSYTINYVPGVLKITKAKPKPKPTPKPTPSINKTAAKIALDAGVKGTSSHGKATAAWGKVKGADYYIVYAAFCGKKYKKVKKVGSGTTKIVIAKIGGKKIGQRNAKYYVAAYKKVNGKTVKLAKSIKAHIVSSKNKKYTNVKYIKAKKSYTLKKGKKAKIKAKLVLEKKGKKTLKHEKKFRYATSNAKVAKVSKKGKIKAVGKGECTVYVYAQNGCAKAITVKVK